MKRLVILCILIVLLVACGPLQAEPSERVTLTVMTHDDFDVSEPVIALFEEENGVEVVFLKSGSVGEALNKAILSRDAPLADIFYGVDNTFLSRALAADIFEPYASPMLAEIPAALILDGEQRALPVDYSYVCLNYDKAYLETHSLAAPQTLEDLLRPEYQDLLVVENPATSSTGLAYLLVTVAHFGDPGYLDYWRELRQNGLVVTDDWGTAYWTAFSGSSGHGPQPLVVSYASSPAAEVYYADPPVSEAPTAAILAPGTCFQQIEFVGILKGTAQRTLAEKFIDFMLDGPFQEDMPLKMFVYPANPNAQLPEVFTPWAEVPDEPVSMDIDLIASQREAWVEAWTEAVIR